MTEVHVPAPTYVYVLEDVYEGYDHDNRDILGVFTSMDLAKEYGNAYRQDELEWDDDRMWSKAQYDRDQHLHIGCHYLDSICPRVICGTA